MTVLKWAGLLIATLVVAADAVTNLMLTSMHGVEVPAVVDMLAAAVAGALTVISFGAHLFDRLDTKQDLTIELLVARFEEIERRIGDWEDGFAHGYRAGGARADAMLSGPDGLPAFDPRPAFGTLPAQGPHATGSAAESALPASV
jgi:hypothetical protein